MPSIFISYRRADSRAHAGRIHDRLAAEFGHDAVFKDVDDIPDGAVFPRLLQETLKNTDVLLAIIGPKWIGATDKHGNPRLHNQNDFTRLEIEAALARESCVVIPLLVDGASMPDREDLPESLHGLADRNARVIRDDPDFHADMDRLVRRLRELDRKPAPLPPASEPQRAPSIEQLPAPKALQPRKRRRWVATIATVGIIAVLAAGAIAIYDETRRRVSPTLDGGSIIDAMESLAPLPTATVIPDYWDGSRGNLGIAKRFDSENCTGFTPNDLYAYGPDWTYIIDNDEVEEYTGATEIVISPGGTLAAVEDHGLYRLDTGERLYAIGGAPKFSADGRYVASDYLGVYDVAGDRLIRNARASEEYSAISPDGRLIVSRGLQGTGAFVFDMQTGETIIEDESGHGFEDANFSPSGRLLAIAGVGVFEMPDGPPLIEGDVGTTFSPYELHIGGGSIIADIYANEILLSFDEARRVFFTPDNHYMAVENEGLYDLPTMEMVFSLPDDSAIAMSHDGRTLAVQPVGWYKIPGGEITRIDDVGENPYDTPPLFSRDDNVVAFDGVGIYGVETGRRLAAFPHDFVAFGITRPLILAEMNGDDDGEGCVMLADRGSFSFAVPIPTD
jgi:hypothetical protein